MATFDEVGSRAGIVADAVGAAASAARYCGVAVAELVTPDELAQACQLFRTIWRPDPTNPPVSPELLRALAKSGNYVAGVTRGGVLIGASFAFFGAPAQAALYSHIAGVLSNEAGRGVGRALKLHQRAWAMHRGGEAISWTFDPLVRRNAYFNLARLRTAPQEYLTHFYGSMHDAINGRDDTDRLMVRWELAAAEVVAASTEVTELAEVAPLGAGVALSAGSRGEPVRGQATGAVVLIDVPADIEALRVADPLAAREWRIALRDVLGGLMSTGARVTGFLRSGGYVVDTTSAGHST